MKSYMLILLLLCVENFAQAPDAVAPLSQNNYWVYLDDYISKTWKTIQVTDTGKYIDSIKYFEVDVKRSDYSFSYKQLFRLREDGYYVMRRDTSFPGLNHEQIYYKKNAKLGDHWQQVLDATDTLYFTILDTAQVHFFNKTRTIKLLNIRNYSGLLNKEQIWSEEFGKLSDDHNEGFTDNLMGCIINNVLYGDTLITGIEKNEINIGSYSLLQNYPNPFNPTTNIVYQIKEKGFVSLKVFDILGREVSQLVNETKEPGEYIVTFNASNPANGTVLPSGIYIYSLIVNNPKGIGFVSNQKMTLVK